MYTDLICNMLPPAIFVFSIRTVVLIIVDSEQQQPKYSETKTVWYNKQSITVSELERKSGLF